MDDKTIIAIAALIISAITSFTSVFLNIRTIRESNRLAKASRRTMALNCLSDEKLALLKVSTECESLYLLIEASPDNFNMKGYLLSEAERIVDESKMLLAQVELKRASVETRIKLLSAAEIEVIIAESYQGKTLAEAQLNRTTRSKEDTVRLYLKD
jgi:hypothetical protein